MTAVPDPCPTHHQPLIELDAMALSVVEGDGLDVLEAVERPGEAGGGILAAGEQHQGGTRIDHFGVYGLQPFAALYCWNF